MSWRYQIEGGQISHDGLRLGTGYSGHGAGKNNPALVGAHDVGPIPPGFYQIGDAYSDPAKGSFVMRLTPMDGTNVFGRSGFLIHGDSIEHPGEASHGCIVLNAGCRRSIATSSDKILEVTA